MRSLRKHTLRYSESLFNASNDSSRLEGRDLIPKLPLSKSDILYTFLSIGLPGSILFLIPSSPAATMAENARYGFADGSGAPSFRYTEAQILQAEEYPDMRVMLESNHNIAHNYIGGTIGDPHTSFRDPFVFLIHSNVDRLFASWQLQPEKEWRLDPDRIYGSEADTTTTGTYPEAHIGIFDQWKNVRIVPGRPISSP